MHSLQVVSLLAIPIRIQLFICCRGLYPFDFAASPLSLFSISLYLAICCLALAFVFPIFLPFLRRPKDFSFFYRLPLISAFCFLALARLFFVDFTAQRALSPIYILYFVSRLQLDCFYWLHCSGFAFALALASNYVPPNFACDFTAAYAPSYLFYYFPPCGTTEFLFDFTLLLRA